jgi:Tfp pilus assembly protein PilO
MRVSTKRIVSILIAAVLVIGALTVYGSAIAPTVRDITTKRGQVLGRSQTLENQSQVVRDVQGLIAEFKNAAALERTVNLAVPNKEETISGLRQVEAAARASGVFVTSLDFEIAPPRAAQLSFLKKLGVLTVRVGATGSYANLKAFLRLLETSVRIANVQDVAFKSASAAQGQESVAVTLEMYYQTEGRLTAPKKGSSAQ